MKKESESQTGSITVHQLGAICVLIVVALLVLAGSRIISMKQELQVKADSIALGSAQLLADYYGMEEAPAYACAEARRLAKLNMVEVDFCVASKKEVWVLIRNLVYDYGSFSSAHAGISTEFEIW